MSITIRKGDDLHVHLRFARMLAIVLAFTAQRFRRALVMPNVPAIHTAQDIEWYRNLIRKELYALGCPLLEPLMTIKITDGTTPEIVRAAHAAGAIAGKLYPLGVTTASQDGVAGLTEAILAAFAEMERLRMVLCIHAEEAVAYWTVREQAAHPLIITICKTFPDLRIVVEHISTRATVELIKSLPANVAGSITAVHMTTTTQDILCWRDERGNEGLNPWLYCKPLPQGPEDMEALIEAATSGNPKFFFGSDSAPHFPHYKEAWPARPGVFSAPVALEILAEIFERRNALGKLENFVAKFGADFYGLPYNEETITLNEEEWTVPRDYHGVVPLWARKKLKYKVRAVELTHAA